jgi:hypothetical protein
MAREDLERFRERVLREPALQERLMQAPDTRSFTELAVGLGAEQGCAFTAEELQAAMQEARRALREQWV